MPEKIERAKIIGEYFAELGRKLSPEARSRGGKTTWANLTSEQREAKMAKMRASRRPKRGWNRSSGF